MARTGRPQVARRAVPCAGCGSEVVRRESDLARLRTGRVFCSKDCRDRVGCKPRRGESIPCGACGQPVYQPPGQRRTYCGKQCHDQGQRLGHQATCEECGKGFWAKPSQLAQGRKFCSRACTANGLMVRRLDRIHNGRPARLNPEGYVYVWEPGHPAAYGAGWIFEHRLVAEQTLGRRLTSEEEVHHINRDKADNRPENLVVLSGADHGVITALDNWRDLRDLKAKLARYRELYGELPEE